MYLLAYCTNEEEWTQWNLDETQLVVVFLQYINAAFDRDTMSINN